MTQNQQSPGRISRYICCLSALHTLPNTWHLLSGSHVPRASHTFYLRVFTLIIKCKMLKSFLSKAEGNGFIWICMVTTQMNQHSMKSSIPVAGTKGAARLERGTAARCSPACPVLWGQSTDPTAALLCFLSWHHPDSTIISGVVAISSYVKNGDAPT